MSELALPDQPGTEIAVFSGGGVALTEHASITTVGLQIAHADESEVLRIAEGLSVVTDAACFAVGDLANFYREHFPAHYRIWIDTGNPVKGLDSKTVKVYAAVCAFYPHDQRARHMAKYAGHPGVSFSHFSRVRRLGAEQAEYWLGQAAENGWSLGEMDQRIDQGAIGADEVPTRPTGPLKYKHGNAFWLGTPEDPQRHLVVCGDARVPEHVAFIGNMGRASMVWTDPPYGVTYTGSAVPSKTRESVDRPLDNDAIRGDEVRAMLVGAWRALTPHVIESCPFYVAGPTDINGVDFYLSFGEAGWLFKQQLQWVKSRQAFGRNDYHHRHEAIYYGQAPGPLKGRHARMMNRETLWYGTDSETTVFEVPTPQRSDEHPTMKPVKLIIPAITNSSQPGEIVADTFAGSGSTIIAADLTGRRCFAIEYDPYYAEVIEERWKQHLVRLAQGLVIDGVATEEPEPAGTATMAEE